MSPTQLKAIMSSPGLPPNIVQSSGPLILGYLMNWGLFGVVSIQVYFYYIAFPQDRLFCKILVYGVYILEALQTIVVTHDAFASFGAGFGSFEALDNIQLTCLSIPILSGIVGCAVQMFYAYRISILSGSRTVGFLISVVSAVGCIAGIVTGVKSFELGSLSKLTQPTVFISAGFWWGCCALCDVTIALAMTYLLSRHNTGFRATHLLVSRLTRLIIETGTCTAVVAIINLILFFRFPKTNYYTVPVLIIAKLYSNTLLVLFNSRMRIVGSREEEAQQTTMDIATQNCRAPVFAHSMTGFKPSSLPWANTRNITANEEDPIRPTYFNDHLCTEMGILVTRDVCISKDNEIGMTDSGTHKDRL